MRGGDHGWGTSDKERTQYRYSATTQSPALAAPAVVVSAEPVAAIDSEIERLFVEHGFIYHKCVELGRAILALATPVGPDAVDARLRDWKFTPDEEGMQVVSPSGDSCYLWDLDSRQGDQSIAGMCLREVMRQLCQDIAFASPLASTKPSKGAV